MNNLKAVLFTLTLSFVVLLLASCDWNKVVQFSEKVLNREEVAEKNYNIMVFLPAGEDFWRQSFRKWAEMACKEIKKNNPGSNAELIVSADPQEQNKQLQDLLKKRKKIDGLVIFTENPSAVAHNCNEFRKQGTFLTVINNNVPCNFSPNLTVIGDNRQIGERSAKAILKELDEGKNPAKILVIYDEETQGVQTRLHAFETFLRDYPKLAIDIVGCQSVHGNPYEAMTAYLNGHPQLDAVWACWDDVLVETIHAYKDSGRADVRCFVSVGGAPEALKLLQDPESKLVLDSTYPPKMVYHAIMETFRMAGNNSREDLAVMSPTFLIYPSQSATPTNVQKYLDGGNEE